VGELLFLVWQTVLPTYITLYTTTTFSQDEDEEEEEKNLAYITHTIMHSLVL